MSQNFITDFPGTCSDWNGYARYDFKLDGVDCILVKPNVPEAAGRPWYHRARFFGAFPFADLALLAAGTVIQKDLDSDSHRQLIDEFIENVGDHP